MCKGSINEQLTKGYAKNITDFNRTVHTETWEKVQIDIDRK